MKKRWRPRPVGGIGLAMGLVVLWHFEPYLMPWLSDQPVARALIALGLAGAGGLVGWLVLVLITRTWPGRRKKERAETAADSRKKEHAEPAGDG